VEDIKEKLKELKKKEDWRKALKTVKKMRESLIKQKKREIKKQLFWSEPVFKEFKEMCNYYGWREGTIDRYLRELKFLIKICRDQGKKINSLRDFNKQDITEYIIRRSTQSQSKHIVYSFAKRLTEYIGLEMKIPKPKMTTRWRGNEVVWTPEEFRRFLAYIDQKYGKTWTLVFSVLWFSGARVSEVINIKKKDILEDRIRVIRKGGRESFIFLPSQLLKKVKDFAQGLNEDDRLFPFSRQLVEKIMVKCGQAVGIERKKLFPHALRHSFATLALDRGIDVRIVQKLLDHTDIRITMRYSHIRDDYLMKELKKVVETLN